MKENEIKFATVTTSNARIKLKIDKFLVSWRWFFFVSYLESIELFYLVNIVETFHSHRLFISILPIDNWHYLDLTNNFSIYMNFIYAFFSRSSNDNEHFMRCVS